ncbi:MAG: hypothetical protein AB7N80_05450 [Bdellovibrionales bacterium]
MNARVLILILIGGLQANALAASAKTPKSVVKVDAPKVSSWSFGTSYGVSTDLADRSMPRLYYQGLSVDIGYVINPRWNLSMGLSANFTTVDGQIDKKQEDSALESTGVNPSLNLSYNPGDFSPWFINAGGTALMDTASRRGGYLGLLSMSGGGTWNFFDDRFSMTHSLALSELLNSYDYSSGGAANPGTSVTYSWGNTLKLGSHFSLSAGFGLKQTRYLDGFWDYSYSNTASLSVLGEAWSMSLSTGNGGYTEDGRVSLWYIDQYRRIVSFSAAYQF